MLVLTMDQIKASLYAVRK